MVDKGVKGKKSSKKQQKPASKKKNKPKVKKVQKTQPSIKKNTKTKKKQKSQPEKKEPQEPKKVIKTGPVKVTIAKPKKKTFQWIILFIAIIFIIAVLWFVLSPGVGEKAQLVVESGVVEVKHGGGAWVAAENGMDLYQSDSVRTGDNSSASVILFKTSIVRLDSNTEVKLEELIREEETSVTLKQDSGRTWNTISKISGIDNYEVQTPTTVASIRGTAFVVIVFENDSTYYGVEHGVLNVSSISNGVIKDSIDVSGNESVFVFIDLINEKLEIVPFEMDEWVLENLLKDTEFVGDLKEILYERIEEYIPELKAEYGINDEELDALLEGYIRGYFDIPADAPGWIKELFEFT